MDSTMKSNEVAPWWTKWAVAGGISALVLAYRGYVSLKRRCHCTTNMVGKTVLITGGNSGIGKATAMDLAQRGARVILACRSVEAGQSAANHIISRTGNKEVFVRKVDLASFTSVREFCKGIKENETKIHVLVNNAGIYHHPLAKSEDGIEMHMAVNHFGHFLMTALLLRLLQEAAPSRIVVVGSSLFKRGKLDFKDINMEKGFSEARAYSTSKLANVLFVRELSRRLEGSGVSVYCIHPGMVMTNMSRYVMSGTARFFLQPLGILLGLKTATEGCQTVVYCSCEESIQAESGGYYGNCHQEPWAPPALDEGAAKKLWELSEEMTGVTIP